MSSKGSVCSPASWAASLASQAFFLLTKAAPLVAFAILTRAILAFCSRSSFGFGFGFGSQGGATRRLDSRALASASATTTIAILASSLLAWPAAINRVAHLLRLSLVGALVLVVNAAKVGHDNWNWQRDDEYTAKRANAAHYFANHGCRHHVAVPGFVGVVVVVAVG